MDKNIRPLSQDSLGASVPIVIARARGGLEHRPPVSTGSWAEVVLYWNRQNRAGRAAKLSLIDPIRT